VPLHRLQKDHRFRAVCGRSDSQGEEEIAAPNGNGRVGTRLPKYNAQDLVLGFHKYVDDIKMAGMVFGALRFSDHPRATVLR
jgi:aldehyde oxidoreductase